jgi:hypothetical protein
LCTQIEAYKCLNTKPLDLNVFDVTEIKWMNITCDLTVQSLSRASVERHTDIHAYVLGMKPAAAEWENSGGKKNSMTQEQTEPQTGYHR